MSTYTVYKKASVFMPTNKKRLFLLLGCPFQGCLVINSVFGRLCRKTVPGGGKTRGLVPRDDVLTNGFIRFSLARTLARILIVPVLRPPPQKPRRHCEPEGSYLRYLKRFDHRSHSYKFCHCSSLSQLMMLALGNSEKCSRCIQTHTPFTVGSH